jgi:hypothetical protein
VTRPLCGGARERPARWHQSTRFVWVVKWVLFGCGWLA